jgi:hypothetical protein
MTAHYIMLMCNSEERQTESHTAEMWYINEMFQVNTKILMYNERTSVCGLQRTHTELPHYVWLDMNVAVESIQRS